MRPLQAPTMRSRAATSARSTLAAWRSSVRRARCTSWPRCARSSALLTPRAEARLLRTTSKSSQASCTSRSTALKSCGHLACNCLQATTPPRMSCCSTFRASGWQTRSRKVSSAKETRVLGAHAAAEMTSARAATSSRNARAWMDVATRSARPLAICPSVRGMSVPVPAAMAMLSLAPGPSRPRAAVKRSRTAVSFWSWPCT
mmetsp:Transcript_17267/g.54555  ORF Transcript_17267/g.54555 Transcript_17267/m.54555 type:complete len:202 (-) Transcript_17267:1009-1614(-)